MGVHLLRWGVGTFTLIRSSVGKGRGLAVAVAAVAAAVAAQRRNREKRPGRGPPASRVAAIRPAESQSIRLGPTTTEKTWFRMQLSDEDGLPMAGEDYVVVDSAGARRQGKLDTNGELYIPPVLPVGNWRHQLPQHPSEPEKRK